MAGSDNLANARQIAAFGLWRENEAKTWKRSQRDDHRDKTYCHDMKIDLNERQDINIHELNETLNEAKMTCTHTEGPQHNCQHVDSRNRLIHHAANIANREVPQRADGTWPNGAWNRAFLGAMDRLVRHEEIVEEIVAKANPTSLPLEPITPTMTLMS